MHVVVKCQWCPVRLTPAIYRAQNTCKSDRICTSHPLETTHYRKSDLQVILYVKAIELDQRILVIMK